MAFRLCSLSLLVLFVSASHVSAQDRLRYREFALGSDLASVAALAGVPPASAELVHERPVVMKKLEWRPRYSSLSSQSQTDPVDVVAFDFYDDQLFRVTVDYASRRIEGLTSADLIDSISAVYGPPSKVLPKTVRSSNAYGAADTTVALWGDADYSAVLLQVAYPSSFKLVVTLNRLDILARRASTEAGRLDVAEAPQRELDRERKEADEALDALKKAAIANKAVFRP